MKQLARGAADGAPGAPDAALPDTGQADAMACGIGHSLQIDGVDGSLVELFGDPGASDALQLQRPWLYR